MTTDFIAILSSATCGPACWQAKENICKCSCGGKNHGIACPGHSNFTGEIPTRQSRIDGTRYELIQVDTWRNLYEIVKKLLKELPPKRTSQYTASVFEDGKIVPVLKTYNYYWNETDPGSPYRLKSASKQQRKSWPELNNFSGSPYLLWKKMEDQLLEVEITEFEL